MKKNPLAITTRKPLEGRLGLPYSSMFKKRVCQLFGGDRGQQAEALVDSLAYGAIEGGLMGVASVMVGRRR